MLWITFTYVGGGVLLLFFVILLVVFSKMKSKQKRLQNEVMQLSSKMKKHKVCSEKMILIKDKMLEELKYRIDDKDNILRDKVSKINSELEEYKYKSEQYRKEINRLEFEKDERIKNEIEKVKDEYEGQIKSLYDEKKAHKKDYRRLNDDLMRERKKEREAEENLENLKEESLYLQFQFGELLKVKEEIESKLELKDKVVKSLKQSTIDLNNDYENLKNDKQNLTNEYMKLKAERTKYKNAISNFELEIEKELKVKEKSLEVLKKRYNSLEKEVNVCKGDYDNQLRDLKGNLSLKEKENKKLDSANKKYQKKLNEFKGAKLELKKELTKQNRDIKKLSEEVEKYKSDKTVKSEVRGLKLTQNKIYQPNINTKLFEVEQPLKELEKDRSELSTYKEKLERELKEKNKKYISDIKCALSNEGININTIIAETDKLKSKKKMEKVSKR